MQKLKPYVSWIVLGVVVIIAAVWWGIKQKSPGNPVPAQQVETQGQSNITDNQKTESGQVLEGTLKISDNLKKGNLMLITSNNQVLYIHTSRDYSSLYNKQVQVTYQGTTTDFRLGDIMAK